MSITLRIRRCSAIFSNYRHKTALPEAREKHPIKSEFNFCKGGYSPATHPRRGGANPPSIINRAQVLDVPSKYYEACLEYTQAGRNYTVLTFCMHTTLRTRAILFRDDHVGGGRFRFGDAGAAAAGMS